jgi:uncharacterized protein
MSAHEQGDAAAIPEDLAGPHGAPIAHAERIVALDALRGFALLGIVLINVMIFSHGFWNMQPLHTRYTAWWNQLALGLDSVLVAGKANSLFSFLFGVGFALQLRRLDDGRARGVSVYLRRLAVLFVFGLAHALLLWSGDVLHHYAVLGLALLALRKVPRRWLFAIIVATFLVPQAVRLYRTATTTPETRAERQAFALEMRTRADEAYSGGSYAQAVRVRAREVKSLTIGRPVDGLDWLLTLAVTILLGLHFGRERLIEQAAERAAFWARLQKWSLALGLGSGLLSLALGWSLPPGRPTMTGFFAGLLFDLCRPTLMLFYASTIVRVCVRRPNAPWLAPIAAAGRMPLTNYLMQSVLCTLVFYGYGLGLYGKTPPLTFLGIAAAVWALEVLWSRWWLRYFLFGPAEWLWRVLTYGKWLPARRPAPDAGAE